MDIGTFVASGKEGMVFRNGDVATKVYYDRIDGKNYASWEFNGLKKGFDAGINVPEPYETTTVEIEKEKLEGIGKIKMIFRGSMGSDTRKFDAKVFANKKLHAVRKKFIEGESLYDRWLPNPLIQWKLIQLHGDLERAGLFYAENKAHNFVLTPDNDIYIIDGVAILPAEGAHWITRHISRLYTPGSKLEEWASVPFSVLNPFNALG